MEKRNGSRRFCNAGGVDVNIIEVIKSGKQFKRKMYSEWLTYEDRCIYNTRMYLFYHENNIPIQDVVAED